MANAHQEALVTVTLLGDLWARRGYLHDVHAMLHQQGALSLRILRVLHPLIADVGRMIHDESIPLGYDTNGYPDSYEFNYLTRFYGMASDKLTGQNASLKGEDIIGRRNRFMAMAALGVVEALQSKPVNMSNMTVRDQILWEAIINGESVSMPETPSYFRTSGGTLLRVIEGGLSKGPKL